MTTLTVTLPADLAQLLQQAAATHIQGSPEAMLEAMIRGWPQLNESRTDAWNRLQTLQIAYADLYAEVEHLRGTLDQILQRLANVKNDLL